MNILPSQEPSRFVYLKIRKLLKDKIIYTIWVLFAFQVVIVHFIVHGPVSPDFRNLILFKLHLFLFISIIVLSTICYINQYIRSFQKNFNFLQITNESFVEREPSKEGCRTTKSSLSIGIIFVAFPLWSSVFLAISSTSNLELPSYPLASSQSMTKILEQSVFKV